MLRSTRAATPNIALRQILGMSVPKVRRKVYRDHLTRAERFMKKAMEEINAARDSETTETGDAEKTD